MLSIFSRKKKRFIGINYGVHDAGIAVYDSDGTLLLASQAERYKRIKSNHLIGNINERLQLANLAPLSKNDNIFTVKPANAGELFGYLAQKDKEQEKTKSNPFLLPYASIFSKYNFYHVDHHLSHAACAWQFRTPDVSEESLYIVFDGWGFKSDLTSGFYSIGTIGPKGITEFERNKLPSKQFASSFRLDHLKMPGTRPLSVAGKLMGLAGYFPDTKYIPFENINLEALEKRFNELGETMDESLMKEYANVYYSYIEDVKNEIEKILQKYPHKNVVVGGGTFLALELNSFIVESGRNLIFAPPTNDSGIALGAGALGYFLITGKWPKVFESPFFEWGPKQHPTHPISPQKAAEILVDKNKPIGVIIGKAEVGPRALGHRSLLAVPTLENKKLLSETIKKREFYRPVAPIVTDRHFDKFFTGPRGKYMQFRNFCTPLAEKLIPGIVHNDKTARAQVLERKDNPWLYDVLVEVGKKTGAECLINTSLNGPGKPISNTLEDVKKEMDTSLFQLIIME